MPSRRDLIYQSGLEERQAGLAGIHVSFYVPKHRRALKKRRIGYFPGI